MSSPPFWIVPLLAFILDFLIGDPEFPWHPIRLMGRATTWLEPRMRRLPVPEFPAGLLLTVLLVSGVWLATWLVLGLAGWLHPAARWGLEILLTYFFLACRDLDLAAMRVHESLVAGDLDTARQRLSRIVGREVDRLDESAVARAASETVAENLVDGILSPLFYLALGGVPLMAAYKMINTLDSMIGYKNPTYYHFGKAAARLDDVANFLPARLSVPVVALAAEILFRKGRESLSLARSDGRRHASPNSGFPEAAFAGALGVTFGGPNHYHGELVHKPFIGEGLGEASPAHIRSARRLMWTASVLGVVLAVLVLLMTGH